MNVPAPPRYCLAPHPFVPAILCRLSAGHDREPGGEEHAGRAYWTSSAPAEADPTARTERFPPITDTVRRRPPVPDVRELRGPELLRALADEMDRNGDGGESL